MKMIRATYPAAPRHERDIGRRIAKHIRALANYHRHRQELETLHKLNDRMLNDIVLTSDEAEYCIR